MGKFKVRFKITGLEMEIEGERETIPQVAAALQKQMAGLLAAPQTITNPHATFEEPKNPPIDIDSKSGRKKSSRSRQASSDKSGITPLDFRHDPQQWGSPSQDWTTQQKAIWLLLITEHQASTSEISGGVITATFNKHFRQAGDIKVGNVNRDLGYAKGKNPALVGEDTTKEPPAWYLTAAGKTLAQQLIDKAKNGVGSSS